MGVLCDVLTGSNHFLFKFGIVFLECNVNVKTQLKSNFHLPINQRMIICGSNVFVIQTRIVCLLCVHTHSWK